MQIDSVIMDMENRVENAQAVKEMVVCQMIKDKLIDKKVGEKFLEEWYVIVIKRKWYKRWWDKIKDSDTSDLEGNAYQYKLVRFI